MEKTCPVCGRDLSGVETSVSQIEQEEAIREAFVNERLGHRPAALEAMDLTQFMHGGPGRLLGCADCGTLLRDEAEQANYQEDAYDPVLMRHLYPRYLRSFELKKLQYQPLLRPGAEILEVGSHFGAFLQAAEEWGARPLGLDIGATTSSFARRQGASVKRLSLEEYSPRLRSPEAIFIWNCFEQLDNPSETLLRSYRLLDRHGLLIVRVPNADFYRQQQRRLASRRSKLALQLLGYNNLLGFPYLHGYTYSGLQRLLRRHCFDPLSIYKSSLLTPPYPDLSPQFQREWRRTRRQGESSPMSYGPWIEVVCRRRNSD